MKTENHKMRQGFTLIEFIFVIVIIALLAGIAIPKLAATRMDAKLSTKAQNIMTAANEIASYAIAKGYTEDNLSNMSNSIQNMLSRGEATETAAHQIDIKVEESDDCIVLKIEDAGTNTEKLVIEYGSHTNGDCNQLRSLVDSEAFPMPLHGILI
jgi:prepilin-type N-terminal cleavage/methylation domain-containing protein